MPHLLAAFMDCSVGVLITNLLWYYRYGVLPCFSAQLGGALLAVLPDIDTLPGILLGIDFGPDHHRWITHHPWFMVTLGILLGGLFAGWRSKALRERGALLGFLCVAWHFIHDTPHGIAWFAPFSHEYLPFGRLVEYGPGVTFFDLWIQPSKLSLFELCAGTAALFIAAMVRRQPRYQLTAIGISASVWLSASITWGMWPLAGTAVAVASP